VKRMADHFWLVVRVPYAADKGVVAEVTWLATYSGPSAVELSAYRLVHGPPPLGGFVIPATELAIVPTTANPISAACESEPVLPVVGV